jgi:hypothetical protein
VEIHIARWTTLALSRYGIEVNYIKLANMISLDAVKITDV